MHGIRQQAFNPGKADVAGGCQGIGQTVDTHGKRGAGMVSRAGCRDSLHGTSVDAHAGEWEVIRAIGS